MKFDFQTLDRRTALASAMALCADTVVRAKPASRPGVQPKQMRCADFLDTLGVNTHLGYAGSQYNTVSAVIAALGYCNIRFARDRTLNAALRTGAHYETVAGSGVSFCLFCEPTRPLGTVMDQIAALEAGRPGAVHALEGPNEIKPRFAYQGLMGFAGAQAFMADLRVAARQREPLRNTPIVSFTSDARLPTNCDIANAHPYLKSGNQPGASIRRVTQTWVGPGGIMPGKPMVFTEWGFHTLTGRPSVPGAWQGVDEATQAVLLLNGWLDAASSGLRRLYLYQLLDGAADRPGAPTQENHFGLFRADGEPKPAATAIRTLSGLLGDPSPQARDFRLRPIALRVDCDPYVSTLQLQSAAGENFLVLWNESPVWDSLTDSPLEPRPAAATVAFPTSAPSTVWEVGSPRPPRTATALRRSAITLNAAPIVVKIG